MDTYRYGLEGVQKLQGYFCTDFLAFLGRRDRIVQRNTSGRPEAARSKALCSKAAEVHPAVPVPTWSGGRGWDPCKTAQRLRITQPFIGVSWKLPKLSSQSRAQVLLSLHPWQGQISLMHQSLSHPGTVGASLPTIVGSHPIFLIFPHSWLQISSQHSASSSSLSTWTEVWEKIERTWRIQNVERRKKEATSAPNLGYLILHLKPDQEGMPRQPKRQGGKNLTVSKDLPPPPPIFPPHILCRKILGWDVKI